MNPFHLESNGVERRLHLNGEVTIENDQQTGRYSGQLLRHGTGKRQPQLQAAE